MVTYIVNGVRVDSEGNRVEGPPPESVSTTSLDNAKGGPTPEAAGGGSAAKVPEQKPSRTGRTSGT